MLRVTWKVWNTRASTCQRVSTTPNRSTMRRGRDAVTWPPPQGRPDAGVSMEETALREVSEAAGRDGRIVEPLAGIGYGCVQDGARINKTVHYFLMEPIGGDLTLHDAEFERVRWVPFDEAGGLLSFATERELVASAGVRLSEIGRFLAVEAAVAPS